MAIDPAPYRKRDGYSVGTPILLTIPGLDLSAFASESSIEKSLASDAPLLLWKSQRLGAKRIPYWMKATSTIRILAADAVCPSGTNSERSHALYWWRCAR